jgi:hypothetical protein
METAHLWKQPISDSLTKKAVSKESSVTHTCTGFVVKYCFVRV